MASPASTQPGFPGPIKDWTHHIPVAVYFSALHQVALRWLRGEFNDAPPPEDPKEAEAIEKYLDEICNSTRARPPENGPDLEDIIHDLIANKVPVHFSTASSHRRWVKMAFDLAVAARVLDFEDEMRHRVEVHDMSKFGPYEALGYGVMFGHTKKYRKLEGLDKELWDRALAHHYRENQHHPQFFPAGQDMGPVNVEEAVVDMTACRLERDMRGDITPSDTMFMAEPFLARFTAHDRREVERLVSRWIEGLAHLVSDPDEEQKRLLAAWEGETNLHLVSDELGRN